MIAALYVEKGGVYFGLPDVDPWDEERDARLYAGPWPVVAHPPCEKWCQLAPLNASRLDGYVVGDDGGCFAAALSAVRRFGGVLEHPALSYAWDAFELPRPGAGGWTQAMSDDGLTTEVAQVAYGHEARKSVPTSRARAGQGRRNRATSAFRRLHCLCLYCGQPVRADVCRAREPLSETELRAASANSS